MLCYHNQQLLLKILQNCTYKRWSILRSWNGKSRKITLNSVQSLVYDFPLSSSSRVAAIWKTKCLLIHYFSHTCDSLLELQTKTRILSDHVWTPDLKVTFWYLPQEREAFLTLLLLILKTFAQHISSRNHWQCFSWFCPVLYKINEHCEPQ